MGSSFDMHHNFVYLNKNAGQVFTEFRNFLQNNPSETVILSYQEADTSPGTVYKLYLILLFFSEHGFFLSEKS